MPTNLAGVRIEPGELEDVFDVQITDNLFTNYTADSDVLYGCAAVLMFSNQTRYSHSITFENNTFDYVNVAVYIKGAGPARPVKGGLVFRRNLSRVNDDGYGVNIYHYNLSDTSDERDSGVDVLDLLNEGQAESINRGCFITDDMSDQIGIRPLPTGLITSQSAAEVETISVVHTAAGANRHVLIGVMNDGTVPSSVSYGSQTPTLLRSESRLHLYSLLNATPGTHTVSAVSAIGITNQVIAVVSRPGIASVGTAVSANNSEQTSVSVNVSSATGEIVADFALMVRPEMAAAAGQTERISMDGPGVGYLSVGMSDKPGASSVTMQWETDETFGDNYIIAVPLVPVS